MALAIASTRIRYFSGEYARRRALVAKPQRNRCIAMNILAIDGIIDFVLLQETMDFVCVENPSKRRI